MSSAAARMRAVLDEAPLYEPPQEDVLAQLRPKGRELAAIWSDHYELTLDKQGLIDGLLGTTGLTVIYGESGAGKTFVAIDIACHIAAALAWRGMAVTGGTVLYIAAEAPESVQRRIFAWKRHHAVESLPILVVHSSINLLDQSDVQAILDTIQSIGSPVVFTVVDTLARGMIGNENAPDDMGAFVAACGKIREVTGGHVAIVHHAGKDTARGARGHSSLRAATDTELEVTAADGGGSIRITKSRDEAGQTTFGFRLELVELGINAAGRTVTTCVAVEADAPSGREKRRELGANEKIVFEALAAALVDHGKPAPVARDIPPDVKVVPAEIWLDVSRRYLPHPETKHRTQAFNRACTSLVADGFVRQAGGVAWIP